MTSIGILHPNLDRKEFFTIGKASNLRWLGINSRTLKRQDLDEFRKEFPSVSLLLSGDMQVLALGTRREVAGKSVSRG